MHLPTVPLILLCTYNTPPLTVLRGSPGPETHSIPPRLQQEDSHWASSITPGLLPHSLLTSPLSFPSHMVPNLLRILMLKWVESSHPNADPGEAIASSLFRLRGLR